MLGENGTGKTTFIRMLAGLLKADVKAGEKEPDVGGFSVSYKPQMIAPSFEGSVRALLYAKIKEAYVHPQVRGQKKQGRRRLAARGLPTQRSRSGAAKADRQTGRQPGTV